MCIAKRIIDRPGNHELCIHTQPIEPYEATSESPGRIFWSDFTSESNTFPVNAGSRGRIGNLG